MELRAVDNETFKHSMRRFAASVCVVTTGGGNPSGMTATSVCSLSVDPAAILVALNNKAKTAEAIIANGSFALNVLSSDQVCLAKLFSSDSLRLSKTAYLSRKTIIGVNGDPLIRGACAIIECSVDDIVARGSHSIFVGRVVSTSAQDNDPLVYHNGSYGSFSEATLTSVAQIRTPGLPYDAGVAAIKV